MDKSMVKGMVVGGIAMVVIGAGAVPVYNALSKPRFADVVAVRDVTETVVTPREDCQDVVVQRQAPVKDQQRIAGTIIGGVAGGVLGHQIGGGTGRTVATIAGAAGGAYAGNRVQQNMQKRDVVSSTERRCKTVSDTSQKLVGYDVTYRLEGKEGVLRMQDKPGPTLPVKDGQVVAAPATAPPKS